MNDFSNLASTTLETKEIFHCVRRENFGAKTQAPYHEGATRCPCSCLVSERE
jgi:hypothetical protein